MNRYNLVVFVMVILMVLSLCRPADAQLSKPVFFKSHESNKKPIPSQSINIGDACPDLLITNIINYKTDRIRISDYRGKLLIFDFWATWCKPCISAFSKLDSLRKIFENEVDIIPVAYEDKKVVGPFLKKMEKIKGISLPTIVNDTILSRLFKHIYIPHYVWINGEGIVLAITGSEEVNRKNISEVLEGTRLALSAKIDKNIKIDIQKPLFENSLRLKPTENSQVTGINENINILYKSVLTGYIDWLPRYQNMTSTRFTAGNSTISKLYHFAFAMDTKANANHYYPLLARNRMAFEVNDSIIYKLAQPKEILNDQDKLLEWNKKYSYCYELIVPESLAGREKFKIMQKELNEYYGNLFNIEAKVEKRKAKCLVLIETDSQHKLNTKGGATKQLDNAYYFSVVNTSIDWFINRMASYYWQLSQYPILNETGYSENIDLEINCDLSSITAVNVELNKHGLKFIESEREIDMIVIKERIKQ